jgi:beta,beta-carotene 9',10'-dioxygenase
MNQPPYSIGFSTLTGETRIDDVPVHGAVPSWLQGHLLRIGPARFEVGSQTYNHWFDGLGMIHAFAFNGGHVAYANRALRSRAFQEAMAQGKITQREFATDPCRTLFQRVAAFFFPKFTDNCNVNVDKFADAVVALTETPLPIRFDPRTLETLGVLAHEEGLNGHLSTAHPHFDVQRMRHYNYLLELGRQSRYHLYSTAADTGREAPVATVPAQRPAYMHSFGMTERYLILSEFPLVVNPLRLRLGGKPFIRNYEWKPERGVRFHVIDKETGRVMKSARADPFFAFHHVNAFESGREIVMDIVTYADASVIDSLYLDRLRLAQAVTATGKLTRFRIDMNGGGDIRHELLSDTSIEFPRIDYRNRAGHPYRYVYGAGNEVRDNFIDKLVKLDLEEKRGASWYEDGCYPGEPVFVATPGATEEDDGVILSVVLDARKGASFLLILEASTYKELGRARVPHHIPFGFHGSFLTEKPGSV